MPYFLSFVQYDGSNFCGFQKQRKQRSVQEEIEKILFKLNKKKTLIRFAGRTDSGVHALGNAVSFHLEHDFPPAKVDIILNSHLPRDIRVYGTAIVPENFNPRYKAIKRTYLYVFYCGDFFPPFLAGKAVHLPVSPDVKALNYILRSFEGYHDFSRYTTSLETRNKKRTIYSAFSVKKGDFLYIQISGKSFLHKQIRAIVGCTVQGYKNHKKGEAGLPEIRDRINRSFADNDPPYVFSYAKGEGLYFKKVIFKFD